MTLGTLGPEPQRLRLGLLFLAIGVLLLLWAWGSWLFRTSTTTLDAPVAVGAGEPTPSPQAVQAVRSSPAILLLGFFLVLVFLVTTYALVRGSRRFRELLFRKRSPPTASDDVWAKHRLPQREHDEK